MKRPKKKIKTKRTVRMFGSFNRAIKLLRSGLGIKKKINVRRVKNLENAGECSYSRGTFYIKIHKDLSWDAAILILLHEISHCLDWRSGEDDKSSHGASWGRAYAKVYRIWMELE